MLCSCLFLCMIESFRKNTHTSSFLSSHTDFTACTQAKTGEQPCRRRSLRESYTHILLFAFFRSMPRSHFTTNINNNVVRILYLLSVRLKVIMPPAVSPMFYFFLGFCLLSFLKEITLISLVRFCTRRETTKNIIIVLCPPPSSCYLSPPFAVCKHERDVILYQFQRRVSAVPSTRREMTGSRPSICRL